MSQLAAVPAQVQVAELQHANALLRHGGEQGQRAAPEVDALDQTEPEAVAMAVPQAA